MAWESIGLSGVNAADADHDFTIFANYVLLHNGSGGVVLNSSPGSLTNVIDAAQAGSEAGKRDQSSAFTNSSWIHLYWIWDGSTLSTVSSATAPATGPTLPSGYTYWAYAGALRVDSSGNLLRVRFFQNWAFYLIDLTGTRVLSAGQATTATAVDCSGFVPPNSRIAMFGCSLNPVHTSANVSFIGRIKPTGSAIADIATTPYRVLVQHQVANNTSLAGNNIMMNLDSSQSIDYAINTAPATSGGLSIDVLGYMMPNQAT